MVNKVKCVVCRGVVPIGELPKTKVPSPRATCCDEHRAFAASRPTMDVYMIQKLWDVKAKQDDAIHNFIYRGSA